MRPLEKLTHEGENPNMIGKTRRRPRRKDVSVRSFLCKRSFAQRLIAVLLVLVLCLALILLTFHQTLLGCRPDKIPSTICLAGGDLGKRWDNSLRSLLFWKEQRRVNTEFCLPTSDGDRAMNSIKSFLGLSDKTSQDVYCDATWSVPPTVEETNRVGVPVLTESWLRHIMSFAALQNRIWQTRLMPGSHDQRHSEVGGLKSKSTERDDSCTWLLLQPQFGDWYRPLPQPFRETTHAQSRSYKALLMDMPLVDSYLYEQFPTIWKSPDYQDLHPHQQLQIWLLCLFDQFLSSFTRQQMEVHETIHYLFALPGVNTTHWMIENESDKCHGAKKDQHTAYVITSDSTIVFSSKASIDKKFLQCLTGEVQRGNLGAFTRFDAHGFWSWVKNEIDRAREIGAGFTCSSIPSRLGQAGKESQQSRALPSFESSRWKVTVNELRGTPSPTPRLKVRLAELLTRENCRPGWWCHRCLRNPYYGSFDKCRSTCRACYEKFVCQHDTNDQTDIHMQVHVQERRDRIDSSKRIPRIIHQTWFEELSAEQYPHLQRMQHSWKATGWDYRFYTDDKARDYIQSNFPRRFLDAYNAIVVPAFRADFFRLCVLLLEGGVYADIDVQLEVNLDSFLTDDLSFFVPRDVNVDFWPDANYCTWNGLIGASPGHPVIVQALEDLLNRALNRQDYLDIEGELCGNNASTEIWKLRCSPMLLITGPCALGISISRALNSENLVKGKPIGWLETGNISKKHDPPDDDWGHAMTLLLDRYDLQEQRFSDVGRNLLVASTNPDRVLTRPLREQKPAHETKKVALHYSNFESDIVGSRAYADDVSNNERVYLRIQHSFI